MVLVIAMNSLVKFTVIAVLLLSYLISGEVYNWSSWMQLTDCQLDCSTHGVRSRFRECRRVSDGVPLSRGAPQCPGEWIQSEACNQLLCPEVQPWSPWSSCSVTCGPASSTRRRERRCRPELRPGLCIQPSVTILAETERRDCGNPDCPPVNGGWGTWNAWSNCLATCGWSYRVRNRLCNNPSPSHGGADCGSSSAGYERCLGGECPVVGQWGSWGPCPHVQGSQCVTRPRDQCKEGEVMYCRQCDNPKPEFGGSPCVTGLATDVRECWNTDACNNNIVQPPMDFIIVGFLNTTDLLVRWKRAPFGIPASSFSITWTIAGTDSVGSTDVAVVAKDQQKTLGESYELWIRKLTTRSVLNISIATRSTVGGSLRMSEQLSQSFRVSRVDGGWGQWSSYSSCSPTADCRIPGTHKRSRECNNPVPTNGGLPCPGSAQETSRCFHPC